MTWELQIRRVGGKGHANKTGLRKHLSQYVADWRIPADGIHDVLEIQKILDANRPYSRYRCPGFFWVVAGRKKFTQHMITAPSFRDFPCGAMRDFLRRSNDILSRRQEAALHGYFLTYQRLGKCILGALPFSSLLKKCLKPSSSDLMARTLT